MQESFIPQRHSLCVSYRHAIGHNKEQLMVSLSVMVTSIVQNALIKVGATLAKDYRQVLVENIMFYENLTDPIYHLFRKLIACINRMPDAFKGWTILNDLNWISDDFGTIKLFVLDYLARHLRLDLKTGARLDKEVLPYPSRHSEIRRVHVAYGKENIETPPIDYGHPSGLTL